MNPGDEYIDSYMRKHGNNRTNFKKENFNIWKNSFGEDYQFTVLSHKDEIDVFGAVQGTRLRALPSHDNIDMVVLGFLHIMREYRGKNAMKLAALAVRMNSDKLRDVDNNLNHLGFGKPSSNIFLDKLYEGREKSYWSYESFYKMRHIRIPKLLKFDNITIKSAREVADDEITKYDQSIFPFERRKYILSLLRDPDGFGKVAYDKSGNVIGFGDIIPYPSGECVVSPMYADNEKIAQAIFLNILKGMDLKNPKYWRISVPTLDASGVDDGYRWIQPFLTIEANRIPFAQFSAHLEHPKGFDTKRVYSTVHPSLCPL